MIREMVSTLRVRDFEEATASFTERELDSFNQEVPGYTGNCGKLTVYRGTKWEYETFCTPEAYKAINVYLEQRQPQVRK